MAEVRPVVRIYEERHSLNAQAVALLVPSLYGASVPAANGNADPDLYLCEVRSGLLPVMQVVYVPIYFDIVMRIKALMQCTAVES